MFSKNEKLLNDYPKPIFIKQTEIILRQMKNSVCRVNCKDGSKGSGFFCKIPISHYKDLPVFVTANHVIDENYLNKENKIILEIDDGTKNHIKNLTLNDKFKYTSKKYDITIIEINEYIDDIHEYLELDENILNDPIVYLGNSIYILHYPKQKKVAVSYGILKDQDQYDEHQFSHYCSTDSGSSGSPILNLENSKIIGIHQKADRIGNYNFGSFLYSSIKEFRDSYNYQKQQLKNKKENNYISYYNMIDPINLGQNDKITELYNKLRNKGLVSDIIKTKNPYEYGGLVTYNYIPPHHIAEIRFILSKKYYPMDWHKWIPAWHGTKFEYLESIVENGLQLPGTYLNNGFITPYPKDIPFQNEVLGIKNWENAIYASPNIHYALKYCDIIDINEEKPKWTYNYIPIPENWGWKGVCKIRIRPNTFTKHSSQFVIQYFVGHFGNGETTCIDDIYRISSEKNVLLESIVFINTCDILASNINLNKSIK